MGKVVPKSVRPGMTDLATTPATVMGSYPVYLAGRGNTAKNVSDQRNICSHLADLLSGLALFEFTVEFCLFRVALN